MTMTDGGVKVNSNLYIEIHGLFSLPKPVGDRDGYPRSTAHCLTTMSPLPISVSLSKWLLLANSHVLLMDGNAVRSPI